MARAFSLLAALASVTERAHTEATLASGIAAALAAALPLVHLARGDAPRVVVRDAPMRATFTIPLEDTTLVCAFAADDAELDALVPWGEPLRDAITRVVRASFAQVHALARVAAVSRRALGDSARLRDELDRAASPDSIVATSPAMRRLVHEIVPLVAAQDVTVLLRGESGTGKEVIARRLHARSSRARRPFVAINCGALPETLAESALFGHERGAFTGAVRRHLGVFERAHGGTLLLDEIGELGAAMQARILRALQEGELERVGGSATVRVDVRIVAATHRPLEEMVESGRFRQDLFYRLDVVPIELPPLRDRIEDVEPLARAALLRIATRMGRAVPALDAHDVARLEAWHWPGNVRELENLIERALVLTRGDVIELPATFGAPPPRRAARSTMIERFDDAQRRLITEALEACGGRVYGPTGAAARLGLAPTTLQSKMEKLGLRRR
ncbi:sigma-54 interaction domain-containing protein [Sandaracinus amylolyticus]|uniref:sigma-54 interaction domain-containing protein n=1 Tax=Sandaracinus amylolyticus TaxID=927083 RepID=UPI001F42C29E|nr:sigma 54-interacting transcriptional regulator [Sandaracinus amylolyticus]